MLGVDGDIFIRFPPRSVEHRDEKHAQDRIRATDGSPVHPVHGVKETVMFASKMMNPGFTHAEHRDKMTEVLRSLDLEARANLKLKKVVRRTAETSIHRHRTHLQSKDPDPG